MSTEERPDRRVHDVPHGDRLDAARAVPVRHLAHGAATDRLDEVAVESPLQIVVNGEPFAVSMRTPGADRELVAGFLFSEQVIASAADIRQLTVDTTPGGRDAVRVELAAHVPWPRPSAARQVAMTAACGMCGRVSVESIDVDAPPLASSDWQVAASLVATLPARLRAAQAAFDRTGGLHASGLFDLCGTPVSHAEDVGRHNALDKVIGRALLDGLLPLSGLLLVVSGRSSFEIVQKAHLAGLPLIVAVSAPSSLAVALAAAAGITLTGFVRDGALNVYTHPSRISVQT
jgi:FdhD protein